MSIVKIKKCINILKFKIFKKKENSIHDELYSVFIKYLNTYFCKRDLENTLKLFSPQLTGFGTGVDEVAYNADDLQKLYERDIRQAPNTIDYTIRTIKIDSPLKNAGVISCELNIQTTILEQRVNFNTLRLSVFLKREANKWLLEHMHISLPTMAHGGDEAYPVKELEKRNKILQRLVDEKTKTLKDANQKIEKALKEIKTLRGIIPICSHCKKIRDDSEIWHAIEVYIRDHSDAEFSHSICPECARKYYPDMKIYDEDQ